MSTAALHLDKFARSLCWSPTGSSIADPHEQIIKSKLQKIQLPNSKAPTVATASVAQRSPRPPRPIRCRRTGGAQIPIAQAVPLQSFSRGSSLGGFRTLAASTRWHVISAAGIRNPSQQYISRIQRAMP